MITMIMQDLVREMILKTDLFMAKRGQDIAVRRDLIAAINALTGENSLDTIYVNNVDNFNIPDVAVIPLYNKNFNLFLMDGDVTNTCPFGYTIEVHQRCFDKLTAEELAALIIHDILQNVQSCSAKTRFMKAYNHVISKHKTNTILRLFDDISNSEIVFMIFMDICTRPFRAPITGYDYVGTDEVLKTMNLGDAYDSYLQKVTPLNNNSPEEMIEQETKNDYRCAKTVIDACLDKDIRHYYAMVRNGAPLVTLEHIFGTKGTVASLGFVSRKREFKKRYEPQAMDNVSTALTESFINPRTEAEIRFQIDKIITEMRYAESEAEREVVLIKIRNQRIKLLKTKEKLEDKIKKSPTDKNSIENLNFVLNCLDELEMLREKTVKMEIKEKRYGLWVQYPVGYGG